jgi:hypothetical protein
VEEKVKITKNLDRKKREKEVTHQISWYYVTTKIRKRDYLKNHYEIRKFVQLLNPAYYCGPMT